MDFDAPLNEVYEPRINYPDDWDWDNGDPPGYDPPTGEGWQLWETVSEGSPLTPVCATAEELARYCADPLHGVTIFASDTCSYEKWLHMFLNDKTDVGSLLVMTSTHFGPLVDDPDFIK